MTHPTMGRGHLRRYGFRTDACLPNSRVGDQRVHRGFALHVHNTQLCPTRVIRERKQTTLPEQLASAEDGNKFGRRRGLAACGVAMGGGAFPCEIAMGGGECKLIQGGKPKHKNRKPRHQNSNPRHQNSKPRHTPVLRNAINFGISDAGKL